MFSERLSRLDKHLPRRPSYDEQAPLWLASSSIVGSVGGLGLALLAVNTRGLLRAVSLTFLSLVLCANVVVARRWDQRHRLPRQRSGSPGPAQCGVDPASPNPE